MEFNSMQEVKCVICGAKTRGIPAQMRGRKGWYANGYLDGDFFALCPKHRSDEYHRAAWRSLQCSVPVLTRR